MKKIICLVLFMSLCVFSTTLISQENLQPGDDSVISFIIHLDIPGKSRGVTVEEVKDGGYIITGQTSGGQYGGEDVFLIHTNERGEIIWLKTYGGSGNDHGWAVRQTVDDGYIVAGYTDSFGEGAMDVYLIRTDARGDTLWTKTIGGPGDEYGWDIRNSTDGGFIIAAQTDSGGNGEIDACLIKVDAMGNTEWTRTYGGSEIDRVFSVQQTSDGGYIAGGITYSFTSVSPEDRDGYLVKTDASGIQEWYQTIGEDGYDVVHSVALNKDGGYFLTGYGDSFSASASRDVYLMTTDSQGQVQWLKLYGGPGEERGIKGLQTSDGGFVAIGFTSDNRNIYLVKTDETGEALWKRTFGEDLSIDFGYTVRETRDGGYILTGHSESLDGNDRKIILIKTDKAGLVR